MTAFISIKLLFLFELLRNRGLCVLLNFEHANEQTI